MAFFFPRLKPPAFSGPKPGFPGHPTKSPLQSFFGELSLSLSAKVVQVCRPYLHFGAYRAPVVLAEHPACGGQIPPPPGLTWEEPTEDIPQTSRGMKTCGISLAPLQGFWVSRSALRFMTSTSDGSEASDLVKKKLQSRFHPAICMYLTQHRKRSYLMLACAFILVADWCNMKKIYIYI